MSNVLSSKPALPSDWIDTSVGEAHVVRDALFHCFDMKDWKLPTPDHCWEYPCSGGYKPLVDLLEWKHGAKVVITNGAKQALGATFYALKSLGKMSVGMRSPYWALLPPLIKMHGLVSLVPMNEQSTSHAESELLLLPNNPDGWIGSPELISSLEKSCKDRGVPLIHDAAYYTHSYISHEQSLPSIGDVQIYSLSKMLGLSGLRVGYAVCPNPEYYKLIREYVEAMTVGVSLPSQMFAFDLMNQMRGYPTAVEKFENMSFDSLLQSKKIVQQVSPEVLEIPTDLHQSPGMFGFFKVGPKADFQKAKVNTIDGALFGTPGYIRMNLALPKYQMEDMVARLNDLTK